jgi:hypothetical protein
MPPGIDGFTLRERRMKRLADFDSMQTDAGCWVGLDPDDSPIILSDTSTYELYALDWDRP